MSGQVIFIDDEAAIRQAVQQWLELSGFQVRTFSRAREALSVLDRDFPGVLISDVRMPDLDGLGLLERLIELDADLPVIMVTGHGDVPMAVQALRQGAYDFIEALYPRAPAGQRAPRDGQAPAGLREPSAARAVRPQGAYRIAAAGRVPRHG